jgi:hypothetical protein
MAPVLLERLVMNETVRRVVVVALLLPLWGVPAAGCGGGASNADTGTAGAGGARGGAAGTVAGDGGAGGRAGGAAGGAGGASSSSCRYGEPCTPGQAPCGVCESGTQRYCQCATDAAGQGYWSCNNGLSCGSANCGLADTTCNPRFQTSCEQCDSSGARHRCQCTPRESQGFWSCWSTAGGCGVSCGDRQCLPGEICLLKGYYPGVFLDAGTPQITLTPYCVALPATCGTSQPSCSSCISAAFSCGSPGTCRDLGPETFECILGGA